MFSTNIAIINGDSSYNRRHKKGHFKGDSIPFGALVDFMPQPETRVDSMGAKTIPGVFVGYHIQPGGLWNGDYLVADLAPFREDCDVAKSKVKIHRTKEIVKNYGARFIFPVAYWRYRRLISGSDETDATVFPSCIPEGADVARASGDAPLPPDAPPVETMPAQAGSSSANGVAPGTDTRGMGLETFEGRGAVRHRKGTSRPPTISPELWQSISAKRKKEAIADYELDLLTARNANAVPPGPAVGPALVAADASLGYEADSGDEIPRLPRAESSDEQGPHREKNDWHPPCCIARKLSKKEMTTDIKAKAALDAEWENYVFSSAPIPRQESVPGTRVMSVKLRLSVVKRKLLAKQFTLHELSNFVTKKVANWRPETPIAK